MSFSSLIQRSTETRLREAVVGSVARTLSELAYLSVVEAGAAGGEMVVAGELIFRDRDRQMVAGSLSLAFDALAISSLTATMLARSSFDSLMLDERQDAALELVNVSAGNLLPLLFGARREFSVSLPRLRQLPSELISPWIGMRCDHGTIGICFSMD